MNIPEETRTEGETERLRLIALIRVVPWERMSLEKLKKIYLIIRG